MSIEQDTKTIAEQKAELQTRYDELEAQRRRLRLDFLPMKREMDNLEGVVQHFTEKLEEAERKVEELQAKIDEISSQDSALEDEQMAIDDELDLLKEVGN